MASIIQQTRDRLSQFLNTPIRYNPNSFAGKVVNNVVRPVLSANQAVSQKYIYNPQQGYFPQAQKSALERQMLNNRIAQVGYRGLTPQEQQAYLAPAWDLAGASGGMITKARPAANFVLNQIKLNTGTAIPQIRLSANAVVRSVLSAPPAGIAAGDRAFLSNVQGQVAQGKQVGMQSYDALRKAYQTYVPPAAKKNANMLIPTDPKIMIEDIFRAATDAEKKIKASSQYTKGNMGRFTGSVKKKVTPSTNAQAGLADVKKPFNAFQDITGTTKRTQSINEIIKQGGSPVYHDTTTRGLSGILDTGEIKAFKSFADAALGSKDARISTTRNFDNYSRYSNAPYRIVLDERTLQQKGLPANKEEFETIFRKNIPIKNIKSIAIDRTNPALLHTSEKELTELISKIKSKGIKVEFFDGKVLPDEFSNREVQELARNKVDRVLKAVQANAQKSPRGTEAFGALAGVEVEKDEKGNPKVKFNPEMALLGVAGMAGAKSAISKFDNPRSPFYNIDKLKIDRTAKELLKEQVVGPEKQAIQSIVGKAMSHKEVIAQAQTASDDIIKAIGREKTLEMGAAQLRLRQAIAALAEQKSITPELLEKLRADKAFSENTARLLEQRRIGADAVSPIGKMKLQMLRNIQEVNDNLDEVLKAAEGVDFTNAKEAQAFYRQFVKPKAGEWIDKIRYNSMLSSPKTHIVNISSNWQGTGVLTPVQKTIEGFLDAGISAIARRDRTRFAKEGLEYAKGYYSSVGKAWENMVGVLKGTRIVEDEYLRGVPLATSKAGKAVEGVLDAPGRALEAMDEFFRTMTQGGLEKSYQYRLNKGVKLAPSAEAEAKKLLFRGELTEKGQGKVSEFVGAGAEWVKRATQSPHVVFRWPAKISIPFVNIGANLMKGGLEANPVFGSLNMIGNGDKTAQAAKMIMGGSVMAAGSVLALSDNLTFAEPRDSKNRNAFRAAGMTPYAIKVGDTWVSYDKAHPLLAFQLATVAAVNQALRERKISEGSATAISKGMAKAMEFYVDQSYFKSVGDFYSTIGGDAEGLQKWVTNAPTQFIPFRATASWVTRIIDKYQRQPDPTGTFVERAMQQIFAQMPGLSYTVPERRGPDGQPIEQPNRIANAFLPSKVSSENPRGKDLYDYQTNALRAYKNLKALPKDEANRRASEIKQSNPQLYAWIKKYAQDEKAGLTSKEASTRELNVADYGRTSQIVSELNSLSTPEEKNALIKRYREVGIITDDIMKQLREMRERGEL